MSKRKTLARKVGIGWCGTYYDGSLGWLLPKFLSKHGEPLSVAQRKALREIPNHDYAESDMYRVRITVEPLKNKRGAYIVRRARRERRK